MNPYRLKLRRNYLLPTDKWEDIGTNPYLVVKYIRKRVLSGNACPENICYIFDVPPHGEFWLTECDIEDDIIPCPEYLQRYIELFSND